MEKLSLLNPISTNLSIGLIYALKKIPFEYFKKRSKSSFNLLDSIVHKNIYRIYPHKLICKDESCLIVINDNLIYEDSVYPSEQFSILINDLIIGEIKKIEDELN